MKRFVFLLCGAVWVTFTSGKSYKTDSLAVHLTDMFTTHSTTSVLNDLSVDFSVAAYTQPAAGNCLQSIAERYRCDSVRVENKKENSRRIFFYNQGAVKNSGIVYLDSTGKILYIDVFDKLYGMNRNAHSRLLVKVPFETDEHGSVYLLVRLNNSSRVLRLLFDTGADGMALRKDLADSLGLNVTETQRTSVVGGNMQVDISGHNIVHLDTFSIIEQNIALFKDMHGNSDGIIGNSLAKMFITKVDYDHKELSLYNFGDYNYDASGQAVPVKVQAGLFIVPGNIAITKGKGYNGDFVFDLGAAYSLICFRPFVKHHRLLVDGFKPEYSATTTSMGMVTPTFAGRAALFSFAGIKPIENIPVTLMSGGGQSERWNPGFDGSIGTRIISRYNFTINLQNKEIWLSPDKSYDYPYDFVIGGFLFGFNADGALLVISRVGADSSISLNTGYVISKINNIPAKSLRDGPAMLQRVLDLPAGSKCTLEFIKDSKPYALEIRK